MAITVRFLADIVDWMRNLGESKEALGENEEALAAVMRQAIELGDELGKTTDEIARDFSDGFGIPFDRARRAVEEVTQGTEEFKDAAKDAGKVAEDDLGDGVRNASGKAGDALGELGSIARDVLAGDFGSAAESAISAVGGIAGAVAGGAIGGAIATALGSIVGGWVEAWNNAIKEQEERVTSWADNFIESQSRVLSSAVIAANLQEILLDTEKFKKAEEAARIWGVSTEEAAAAMAGSAPQIEKVSGRLDDMRDAFIEARDSGQLTDEQLRKQLVTLGDATTKYNDLVGEMSAGAQRSDTLNRALALVGGTATTTAEQVRGVAQGIGEIPPNATVTLTINDQATAAVDRIVKTINGRVASITINTKYGSRTME